MRETLADETDEERDELSALRKQVFAAKSRERALESAVSRAEQRFDAFTSTLPGISWETWGRPDETPVSYVSPSVEAITGYTREQWQSQPAFWLDLVHPEDRAQAIREIAEIAASEATQAMQEYRWILKGERICWAHVRFSIVRDEEQNPLVWQAFTLDVTAQKSAESERDALLESQSALLAQLSTPLIPITDEVVAMPLIGPVDRARADRALEVLLAGLATTHTRVAILDVTGVPKIDEEVVHALLRAAAATRLLGAEVFLTGIRAEVAQAICTHGQGFEGVTTCATLKQGIARAMKRARSRM